MTNVVELFKTKEKRELPPVDVTGIILVIANWAEEQGIDIYNDAAFNIRVTDLMTHLEIMAKESRMTA
jgi:hypothetical protein